MISFQTNELVQSLYKGQLELQLKNIHENFTTKYDYDLFCEFITNYMLDDYKRMENNVTIIDENNEEYHITLFQFLINLYFLEFNFMYKIPITKDWLIDVDKEFLKSYHSYIDNMCQNKIYPIIKKKKLNSKRVFSWILSNLTERMTKLTETLSLIAAPTISLFDLSEFCHRNDKFNKLLSTQLDTTKSFHQIENELVEDGKKLKEVIVSDGRSCLVPFIDSNCINEQQLTQLLVAVGPRMSSSNVVMNHVMKTSYLNGLQNVGDYIAEAEIASKALFYKKNYVGVSGYMSRETNLSGMFLKIDYNMEDCGTPNYINYEVESEKHLNFIVGKNMILPNGKLKPVTKNDKDLIGTTIRLRSMCCCAHPDRHHVCKACYGSPKDFKDEYMIGGATSTEVQNPLSNAVMAVKHHSGTKTKEFDNPELLTYFSIVESRLVLKPMHGPEKVSLIFNKEYIEDVLDRLNNDEYDNGDDDDGENDGSSLVSKMLSDVSLVVKTYDEMTEEENEVVTEIKFDGSFLTLSEEMMNLNSIKKIEIPIDSDQAILHLEDIKPGTAVFNVKYITAETSRYLKNLKNIIERAKPTWYDNLDEPIRDFTNLIIEAGLKDKEMVFIEPAIYALTRCPDNVMKRPDFSKKDVKLNVINLKTSIFKGDLYSALIYQELTKIFKDIDSFYKDPSIGEGIHDSLFKTSVKHDFSYMRKALKKGKII